MDLYTREIVVDWSISTKHTTEFIVEVFMVVASNFGIPKVARTDQGSEYKSNIINLVESLGVKVSHSPKASS